MRGFLHHTLGALSIVILAGLLSTAVSAEGADSSKATLWKDGDPGDRLVVSGRVVDASNRPVAGAQIYVRQANGAGVYSDDYSAVLVSGKDGTYQLRTAVPGQYGPAKHIHVNVVHESYRPVYTEIRFKHEPGNTSDPTEILLEEARHKDQVVFVGKFDIVLTQ